MSHITDPTQPLPKGGGPKGSPIRLIRPISPIRHISHISHSPFGGIVGGYQYGPYYRPIWAILLTNMGHITLHLDSYYATKSYL